MKNKENCIVVINNIEGGVFTFSKNIAIHNKNPNLIFTFLVIKKKNQLINLELIEDLNFIIFEYNDFNNFFFTAKKLNKIFSNYSIIIANDGLELKVTWFNKIKPKIIFILHGCYDYYISQAITYQQIIDKFICVNPEISEILNISLPDRSSEIKYIPVPTKDPKYSPIASNQTITLIFVGRLSKEKGILILPQIDKILKTFGVIVNWIVIGQLELDNESELINWLNGSENVNYLGFLTNNSVSEYYKKADILILPSLAEGFPVVVAESMKYGVIPIINDLPGFNKMLKNSKARLIPGNDVNKYVEQII